MKAWKLSSVIAYQKDDTNFDITNIVQSVSIYSSIFTYTMSARITIRDDIRFLLQNKLTSDSKILISFSGPSGNVAVMFQLDEIQNYQMISEKCYIYTLDWIVWNYLEIIRFV